MTAQPHTKKRLHALYAFITLTVIGLLGCLFLVAVLHFNLLQVFFVGILYIFIIDIPVVILIAVLAKEKVKTESDADSAV